MCHLPEKSKCEIGVFRLLAETNEVFERIHVDIAMYNKKYFLILIDSYSKWIDVNILKEATTELIIGELRTVF